MGPLGTSTDRKENPAIGVQQVLNAIRPPAGASSREAAVPTPEIGSPQRHQGRVQAPQDYGRD